MSEAPERIWAVTEPDDVSADILGEVYAQQVPDGMVGSPVEYIRADIVEDLYEALLTAHDYISDIFSGSVWVGDNNKLSRVQPNMVEDDLTSIRAALAKTQEAKKK